MSELYDRVVKLGLCGSGVDYAKGRSSIEFWAECRRGDWMLELLLIYGADKQASIACARECARIASPHAPKDLLDAMDSGKAADASDHPAINSAMVGSIGGAADMGKRYSVKRRRETFARCADIVRECFPDGPGEDFR